MCIRDRLKISTQSTVFTLGEHTTQKGDVFTIEAWNGKGFVVEHSALVLEQGVHGMNRSKFGEESKVEMPMYKAVEYFSKLFRKRGLETFQVKIYSFKKTDTNAN